MSQDFLRALWDPRDYGEIRAIKDGRVCQEFIALDTPDAYELATTVAAEYDADGFDVYIGVLRRKNKGGKATDVVEGAAVLWADVDPYKEWSGKQVPEGWVNARLEPNLSTVLAFPIAPSIIVDSGHGIHAYWLLRGTTTIPEARDAMRGIAKAIGGDHTHDPARVLRLPGTHNYKNWPVVLATGEPCSGAPPVRLLRLDLTRKYRFSDFSEYTERTGSPIDVSGLDKIAMRRISAMYPHSDLPPWLGELIKNGAPRGQRSEQCFKAMIWLLRYGWSDAEIWNVFLANPNGIGQKMAERGPDGERWFFKTLGAARAQA